jgi:antitoxin ChpS
MHTTRLRKVGGSVMLAVPPAFLDQLHIQAGATVGLAVNHGSLLITTNPRPRYTLNELLAQCDASAEISKNDREWLDAYPVGSELL